jgi:hypothetical protein
MTDIITAKREEWRHNLEHLQQRRAELQAALTECDANIMRHQGAIVACDELLKAAEDEETPTA